MTKKNYFEAPQAELIHVSFEDGFLTTSPGGYSNQGEVPETGDDDDQGGF